MKPLLKLQPQFIIPPPFKAWCHLCVLGFMTLEESQKHDRENLNLHQRINGAKEEHAQKTSQKS